MRNPSMVIDNLHRMADRMHSLAKALEKGDDRPITPAENQLAMMAGLPALEEMIDYLTSAFLRGSVNQAYDATTDIQKIPDLYT